MSEELRDALVETIWQASPRDNHSGARLVADALLSGPLAPLLAAEAAIKRVEALWARTHAYPPSAVPLAMLRRALDGPP